GDPVTRRITIRALAHIANRPHFINDDKIVFLGLVMAIRRLGYDGDEESVASVRQLLWDLAVRLEDGGLSQSQDDLAEALQRLSQALGDPNTPAEELERIIQEVNQK